MSPALAGGFLTTMPPGKPLFASILLRILPLCSSVILACVFFFCDIFAWFWYQGDGSLVDEFGRVSSSAIFWNSFRKIGVNSSLNVW